MLLHQLIHLVLSFTLIFILYFYFHVIILLYSTLHNLNIEYIINEFLINFNIIKTFIIEIKLSIESSKGICSIYVYSFPY